MEDRPKRPILRLKLSPAPPPPSPTAVLEWRCKPCGTALKVDPELGDEDSVRCKSCNARLGLAKDFRADPPNLTAVRARPILPKP